MNRSQGSERRAAGSAFSLLCAALLAMCASCENIDSYPYKTCAVAGSEGCACLAGNRCRMLDDGSRLSCETDTCVRPRCSPNDPREKGCRCAGGEPCAEGLICYNDVCATDTGQTLKPPASPVCYTPCQGGGYTDSQGVFQACKDGLVQGCLDGARCVDGSCVSRAASPPPDAGMRSCADAGGCPSCETDSDCGSAMICDSGLCRVDPLFTDVSKDACDEDDDCPDHQACIAKHCYSDCDSSRDCRPGRLCHQRVCRVSCSGDSAACPEGTTCLTDDGTSGFCMPLGIDTSAGAEQQQERTRNELSMTPAGGDYRVEPSILLFSRKTDSATFSIKNEASVPRCFVVRKTSHTEYTKSGPKLIDDYPLHWLSLKSDGQAKAECLQGAPSDAKGGDAAQLVAFKIDAGATATIQIADAYNETLRRWTGDLSVETPGSAPTRVALTFTGSAEGQWVGKAYYFGNFGTLGLDAWLANGRKRDTLSQVGNALIRRWAAVRDQRLTIGEFLAALDQTVSGQWATPSVRARCPSADHPNPNAACYLFNNADGISVYSDYLPDNPVPTGVTEFPIAFNLHAPSEASPGKWSGKIVSERALQFAGSPSVTLQFARDPAVCEAGEDSCITLITGLSANLYVGGRYIATQPDTACIAGPAGTYKRTSIPWLLPGFVQGTQSDSDGKRYRFECRDTLLPFGVSGRGNGKNESLADSNPVPDGTSRKRALELIDGALIDQERMFIVFRERFPSFLSDDDGAFAAYGVMELTLSPKQLNDSDYRGSDLQDDRQPVGLPALSCDGATLEGIGTGLSGLPPSDRGIALVTGIMPTGVPPAPLVDPIMAGPDDEVVHYLCEDTNVFDAGADGQVACPDGSKVTYFTLKGAGASASAVAAQACNVCPADEQDKCGCQRTLDAWVRNKAFGIRLDPAFECLDPDAVSCAGDRFALTRDKRFFRAAATEAFSPSIDQLIEDAFRYKTKFRNREGTSVGFAPQVCSTIPNKTPYCYDPQAIERLRTRVDCTLKTYVDAADRAEIAEAANGQEALTRMRDFLVRSFSYSQEFRTDDNPLVHDGFERLYAELLVMMGDEAVTAAYSSRFDLADQRVATFEGDKFEPAGILVPGGGGYELYSLYQATQYYQLALDRFYRLSPALWEAIGRLPPAQSFITPATVTSYFTRLAKASTAKALAWSQIAKLYQNRNRADLARHVIERAYTAAHLESIIMGKMMLRAIDVPSSPAAAAIQLEIESAQRKYTQALSNMREVYEGLTDNVTYFGFQQDYVPFPVLNPLDTNAFDKALQRAQQKVDLAKEKETIALSDSRAFATSAAEFQSQLASISRDYNGRLGDICGTFEANFGDSGKQIFPATPQYADLNPAIAGLPEPCGLVRNGELWDAQLRFEQAQARFESARKSYANLLADIDDANARATGQCGRIANLKNSVRMSRNRITTMEGVLGGLNEAFNAVRRQFDVISSAAATSKCILIAGVAAGTDCPLAIVGAATSMAAGTALNVAQSTIGAAMVGIQTAASLEETEIQLGQIQTECDALTIDTVFNVKQLFRRSDELMSDVLAVSKDVDISIADIVKLKNEAARLMSDQDETLQLAINVTAAHDDPNVRVYRNGAVLEADRTFNEARREAYRATKVFEYYTSQSYPKLQSLLDVRMVSNGDLTLEAYLSQLGEAFYQFQERFGGADLRLQIVSLRDDIFKIPRLGSTKGSETGVDRRALFQEKLLDPTLLDARGYRRIQFATQIDDVSPNTRNHKIAYVEIEVLSNTQKAESQGRFYLEQVGTSTVHRVDDTLAFYALPQRSAVIETFFNNTRFYDPMVYRNDLLRDRPLLNTRWDLVINTKDERVNKTLDLTQITDVRILFFYNDFVAQSE